MPFPSSAACGLLLDAGALPPNPRDIWGKVKATGSGAVFHLCVNIPGVGGQSPPGWRRVGRLFQALT
jgi:hypothetical protein